MKSHIQVIGTNGSAKTTSSVLAITLVVALGISHSMARPGAGAGGIASGGARGVGVGGAGAGPGHVGGAVGGAGVGVGYHGAGAGARGVGVAPGIGVGAPGIGVLPKGYHATVPAGYRTIAYRGYTCRYVGGVYYRAVMYQGQTVWVVVP